MSNLDEVRRQNGNRNPSLDLNIVREPYEAFVHTLYPGASHAIEVHFPIDWVSIGGNGEMFFNEQARSTLEYAQLLATSS